MRSRPGTSAYTYPLLTSIAIVCLASGAVVAGAHLARDLRGEAVLFPEALVLAEANMTASLDEPPPPEPSPPNLPTTDPEEPDLPPESPRDAVADAEPVVPEPGADDVGEPAAVPEDEAGQPGGSSSPVPEEPETETDEPETETGNRAFTPRPSKAPPPKRTIDAAALPADLGQARNILRDRRGTAVAGSAAAQDIDFALSLASEFIDGPAPEGRKRAIELTIMVNAWWFDRWAAPRRAVVVRDPSGLVYTYRRGRGFALNPVATTGRWQKINDDVPAPALADALLEVGVKRTVRDRDFLLWEYYDVPDQPDVVRPGASGMAQGRLASLLAESYKQTGDTRYAQAALGAVSAFTVPVDDGGVLGSPEDPETGESAPWYVERAFPGENPWKGAALNGFMVTILNLRGTRKRLSVSKADRADQAEQVSPEVRRQTEHTARVAEQLADRGAATLRKFLPLHDTGEWSRYGLLTPGHEFGAYLADVNYHCYHVSLLERLNRIYPNHGFGVTSREWDAYVDAVDLDCATARKAAARS